MIYDKYNNKDVCLYKLENNFISVDITDLGARINALRINGKDIVLGTNNVLDYLASNSYMGATIGRVANRIENGTFRLNNKNYQLVKNDGSNHLHGGNFGFDKQFFEVLEHDETTLKLHYYSHDLEENYPGNLDFYVTYILEKDTLAIYYEGKSDQDTLFNPTNHMYFNLCGEDVNSIEDNYLEINADFYNEARLDLIPTSKLIEVTNTVFDFRKMKKITQDFKANELKNTNGYDHNYILKSNKACVAYSPKAKIKMELETNLPCLQLYTAGALKLTNGKTRTYDKHSGFCLEPQFMPNAINMDVTKPILKANEIANYYIKYKFMVE